MQTRIYLGNLSWDTTEDSLREALAQDGRTVTEIDIKKDTATGRSRGFAFADLGTPEEAEAAISSLDGTELDGRPIKVKSARERGPRTGGFGRSDSGGGGGRFGGGGGGRFGGGGGGRRGGRW